MLYFGFTFCPDICPNELNKITVVVDALDKSWYAGPIAPVLITVDPRRDSAPKMKEYIKQFHPRFVGLTGSEDQILLRCSIVHALGEIIGHDRRGNA